MKVFRDLYLHLPVAKAEYFFNEVEKNLGVNWTREREIEERLSRGAGYNYFCFSCNKTETLEAASVAFARKNDEIVYIANIVPREFGKLSEDQYNSILVDFHERCLLPICAKHSVLVDVTQDNQGMEDWVSGDTYKKLKSFSGAANKSTGSGHPCDETRWFSFIVSVVRKNEKLDPSQLQKWLIEEEKWPQDIASDLATEYEQGISLLKYFIEN